MKKLFLCIPLILSVLLSNASCAEGSAYSEYESTFFGLFDSFAVIKGYAESKDAFDDTVQTVYERLLEFHREFDIYNEYEGMANIKTINDNAGIKPVKVSRNIIDLLLFCEEAYRDTDGAVNALLGPVLKIWHDYREEGLASPENAEIPSITVLRKASELAVIGDMVIDEEEMTVFLNKKGMSIDVGGIAKGYAASSAAAEARGRGCPSLIINLGGNVVCVGRPYGGSRSEWAVGIQDPRLDTEINGTGNTLDTVYVRDAEIISSGNYQRYYEAGGKILGHIIDPATLMPSDFYSAVTVILYGGSDALPGTADMLSTALFILPVEEGRRLLRKFGADAVWVFPDGSMEATEGYKKISKNMANISSEPILK